MYVYYIKRNCRRAKHNKFIILCIRKSGEMLPYGDPLIQSIYTSVTIFQAACMHLLTSQMPGTWTMQHMFKSEPALNRFLVLKCSHATRASGGQRRATLRRAPLASAELGVWSFGRTCFSTCSTSPNFVRCGSRYRLYSYTSQILR